MTTGRTRADGAAEIGQWAQMVEVPRLVDPGALVEIEVEAYVPAGG